MKKEFKKRITMGMGLMILVLSLFFSTGVFAANEVADTTTEIGVAYRGHVQNEGDMPVGENNFITGPEALGTRDRSLRVEGFMIKLTGNVPEGANIVYQVHVQNEGWMTAVSNGDFAGTRAKSQRVESIKISLENMPGYDVYYHGHVQNIGNIPQVDGEWGWVKNGEELGTTGSSLRLEELEVKIVKRADITYAKAGTFGPKTGSQEINNDVVINVPGVTLQNLNIKGSLTIGEGVGEGDVILNNVTVAGDTYIKGGGKNSIHINGGQYNNIIVQQTSSGQTRIVAVGTDGLEVVISEDAKGEDIILEGAFDNVKIDAPNVKITTQGDTKIKEFNVAEGATDSQVTLDSKTTVNKLVLDEKTDIKGQGTVKEANVNKDGVTFEKAPTDQAVDPTVKVPPVVTKPTEPTKPADPVKPPVTPDPGDGGGGGGGTPATIPLSYLGITGNGNVGDAMSVVLRPSDATCSYQWYRSPEENGGGTFTAIPGATGKTYTLQLIDVGCSIRVSVTGSGNYTGSLTSIAFDNVTNLKNLTDGGHMADITISSDEHITSFDKLIASKKLPPEFTVTDGEKTLIAPITRWYDGVNSGPVFDGTIGDKTFYVDWVCPEGYRATIEDIAPKLVIHTTVVQTPNISSEKEIIEAHLGTVSGTNVINIPENTMINNFLEALSISPYSKVDMLDENNEVISTNVHNVTAVAATMKIRVTAEDGSAAIYGVQLANNLPSVGVVSNIKLIPESGDVRFQFDKPTSMMGVNGFDIYFSIDGITWSHKHTVPADDNYNNGQLFVSSAIVASTINTTTDYTQIKVVTVGETGYANNEVIFPYSFKITKDTATVVVSALRNADGSVTVKLPEDKEADQTYLYQLMSTNQDVRIARQISSNDELDWRDVRTFIIPATIAQNTDVSIKVMKVTNGSNTGVTATELSDTTQITAVTTPQTLVAPANLIVTTGAQQAGLSWNASANATGYSIYMRSAEGGTPGEIATGITATTYTATGLTPGQTYYFAVKATAPNYAISPASNEASVVANVNMTGNSLSGNRLIVTNPLLEASTAQDTGVIGNVVAPSAEMFTSDAQGESFQLNPEIPFNGGDNNSTIQSSIEPMITNSNVNDTRNFYTYNYMAPGTYDATAARCAYTGNKVEVWVEAAGNQVQLNNTDAQILGAEFDAKIYDLVTKNFYAASDVDSNGKIIILCYDIKDGYAGSGGYVGGYYNPNDTVVGTNSNNGEILYIDTYPAIGVTKDMTKAKSTMVHEFQHLVNFNCNKTQRGQMATWLNEAISMAAENMYEGVQSERVSYYSNSDAIANGRSLFDWNNTDVLSSYAQSYVFAEYLNNQAKLANGGNQTDIFAKIITDPGDEITALNNTIHSTISSDYGLIEMLPDFRVATVLKSPVGKYGFGADSSLLTGLVPKVSPLTSANLAGGGALIKNIEAGLFTVPETHGEDIRYISVY